MIKFERLSKDAKATIVRNGVQQPVYLGMTLSSSELESLVVSAGTVLYTIDETEVVEVSAKPAVVKPAVVETKAAELPEAQPEVKKPVIVKPVPRTKK